MKPYTTVAVCFILSTNVAMAFAPRSHHARLGSRQSGRPQLQMNREIATSKSNKQFSVGVVGFAVGTILAGPILGSLLSGTANYLSKTDGGVSDTFLQVGEVGITSYNAATSFSSDNIYPKLQEIDGFDDASKAIKSFVKENDISSKTVTALEAVENFIDEGATAVQNIVQRQNNDIF